MKLEKRTPFFNLYLGFEWGFVAGNSFEFFQKKGTKREKYLFCIGNGSPEGVILGILIHVQMIKSRHHHQEEKRQQTTRTATKFLIMLTIDRCGSSPPPPPLICLLVPQVFFEPFFATMFVLSQHFIGCES